MKEYSISDLSDSLSSHVPYYVGKFEEVPDPDIEWAHRHSFYSLVWFTEGEGFYVIDFHEYMIMPDRIFFVNPQQIHNWDYSDNCKGYFLMIEATSISGIDACVSIPYMDVTTHQSLLKDIFLSLIENQDKKDDLTFKTIKTGAAYLYAIVHRLIKEQGIKEMSTSSIIDQLRRFVNKQPTLSTISQYADALHLRIKDLNDECKRCVGVSAKQYIQKQKDTEAKRLLLYSQLDINEIAFSLGYEDASYFSRSFKKLNRCTPTDFMKKYRRKE